MSATKRNLDDLVFDNEKLRALKEASGLSWKEIADRAGASVSYLNDLGSGSIRDPAVSYVVKIAAVLNVSPLALLTNTNDDEVWRAGWNEGVLHAIRSLQEIRSEGPT